jgi:SAM-dependent methyltransferase
MTHTPTPLTFPPEYFRRQDESDDFNFYTDARKVVHIDDAAIATLTDFLRDVLPAGGALLDLMSSWRSHLPPEMPFSRVVGLGMNGEEMADNPQLTEHVVHSLNANPFLPFDDEAFDAAVCTVSVQYLTNPLTVFTEVRRVLKPGAPFVVSFSNRCFPTKAVAIWRATDDQQHMELVAQYFVQAGGWDKIQAQFKEGRRSFFGGGGDPLYVVWAARAAGEHTE